MSDLDKKQVEEVLYVLQHEVQDHKEMILRSSDKEELQTLRGTIKGLNMAKRLIQNKLLSNS